MTNLRRLTLMILILFSICLTGCTKNTRTLNDIIDSNELVVALNAEFPPFEYKNGKEFLGIDVEIISEYAKSIGVSCTINDMDFDATFLSVYSTKADVAISGITVNSKREKKFDFTDAYYYSSQVIIINNNSIYNNTNTKEEIITLLSNSNAKIGVQRGTLGEYYASGDESWGFDGIKNTKTISYDNGALACSDLANGKIDAVIIDEAPARLISEKYEDLAVLEYILTEEKYAIALKKGNDTLLESLNTFIKSIKDNGTLDSIVEKYYA